PGPCAAYSRNARPGAVPAPPGSATRAAAPGGGFRRCRFPSACCASYTVLHTVSSTYYVPHSENFTSLSRGGRLAYGVNRTGGVLMRIFALALAAVLMLASPAQAKPQDKFAQNGAVKIHYVVSGKGPLVVLIHGFPDYWATWKPLMAELNKAGYRTAALDTRGYNLSDKPQGEAAYAMPNLVGDVAAGIAAEKAKDGVVIGQHRGAAIAWQTVFARPELVNKLVILSVPHPAGMARELATNKAQQEGSNYARNFQKEGSEKNLNAEMLAGFHNYLPPAGKA